MVSTRMKTRRATVLHVEKAEGRRKARTSISPEIRAERLSITKAIAAKIVEKQESLGEGRHGCRKKIIVMGKYLHHWLNEGQVDWHVIQIRRQKKLGNNLNSNSVINNDLDFTSNIFSCDTPSLGISDDREDVSMDIEILQTEVSTVDCCLSLGWRASPFWRYPGLEMDSSISRPRKWPT